MYSKLLVSTITSSPASINGGTWIFKPLSRVAGLYEEETVWPFNATSVVSILHWTWFGKLIDIGFSIEQIALISFIYIAVSAALLLFVKNKLNPKYS